MWPTPSQGSVWPAWPPQYGLHHLLGHAVAGRVDETTCPPLLNFLLSWGVGLNGSGDESVGEWELHTHRKPEILHSSGLHDPRVPHGTSFVVLLTFDLPYKGNYLNLCSSSQVNAPTKVMMVLQTSDGGPRSFLGHEGSLTLLSWVASLYSVYKKAVGQLIVIIITHCLISYHCAPKDKIIWGGRLSKWDQNAMQDVALAVVSQ